MTNEQYLFDAKEYPWHSPRYVLEAYNYLLSKYGGETMNSEKTFEKAREMRVTAICLLVMHKALKDHFFMQISREQSPDVRTMVRKEVKGRPVHGFFQEVEVVTFDNNSSETNLIKFLKRTKLSKHYSYDDKTIILCELKKNMILPPYKQLYLELSKLSPTPTIMIVGKISPSTHLYSVCQLWPKLELNTTVDLIAATKNYPSPHNLRLYRGMSQKKSIKKSSEPKPTYYQVFGINESETRKFLPI